MPQYPQPPTLPDWAEGGSALVGQPTPSQQASGFTVNQRPTAQTMNWLFQTLGRSVRWLSQGVNAVMTGASQEPGYRLIGGGTWAWASGPGILAWSDPFAIAMPGLADAANTAAAGSVTMGPGQVAYVQSNAPFTTTGNVTSGSSQITNLAYESGISVGETISGAGIPSGATVVSISTTDASITISAPATATSASTTLVFATSGALTVQVANIASFSPAPNTVVIARCFSSIGSNHVHVGVNAGQMLLRDLEAKPLLSNGYVTTQRLKAAVAIASGATAYVSPGQVGGDSVTYIRSGSNTQNITVYSDPVNNVTVPASMLAVGDIVTSSATTAVITAVAANGAITVNPALPSVNEGFSPYPTTGIAISRQAGLVYPTDAVAGVPLCRAQTAGFVPTATPAGSIAHIVSAGTIGNFKSLTPGAAYYLNIGANQQGQCSVSVPTTVGSTVAPVGYAASSSLLMVNPAAPTQVTVLNNGYKSVIDMGYYYNTNSTVSGLQSTLDVLYASTGTAFMVHRHVFTQPGSVVGLSAHLNNTVTPATTIYLGKQSGVLCQMTIAGNTNDGNVSFTKGSYPFSAGDPLFAYVYFSGQTGINCALRVYATVEFTP